MTNPSPAAGVHSIDHFALTVPDVAKAAHFFEAFGLTVKQSGDGLELYAADGHRSARILPGPSKALAYLSLNCYEADYETLVRQIQAAGGTQVKPGDSGATDAGYWFRDPDGNLVQVKVGPKTMPDEKRPNAHVNIPANERGSLNRSAGGKVYPRRLSHVLLFTPDVSRALQFYESATGLKLSDRSQDIIAFTHARHGSDHHLLAFVKSGAKGWHHSAWDVDGVDHVGRGHAQMAAAGYTEGWGTGRHVLGSNYFYYVRDPWGSFAEFSAHIDYIAKGYEWPSGDHPPEDSLYQWGPDVPPYFIQNTEAA